MKYKQKQPYGCGLYAVANACNLDNFITPERLEHSKTGNRIGQLSKWLQEDGHNFYIDVLYYNHLGKKLPSTLNYVPSGKNILSMPVLIVVQLSENGLQHLISGQITKDGTFFLYDSLKDKEVITTFKKLNSMYYRVFGVYDFVGIDTGDWVFIMNSDKPDKQMTDYVDYEAAVMLKNLGFDLPCWCFFNEEKEFIDTALDNSSTWCDAIPSNHNLYDIDYSAPTLYTAQNWFRKKHSLHVYADCNASGWYWQINRLNGTHVSNSEFGDEYKSHEIALLLGLKEACKLVKDEA